ncbi:MAG: UDP-3-O-[3-hydroxymyristoyl] N-acetylglucosamine deacetylase [Bdellovibrionaceae bacterium]|nr:UDP-3-O-[3-hydroxymyristoyl] N-acetylglucosamine deacetylase [Pseudobdellovibrionaceae bacterium]|tara:strand:+ start:3314 stop:4225 length:912 start_codon:yes stop_codon:yes gene_type:complete
MKTHQRTIKDAITMRGIGLHSGKNIELRLLPADPGQGVTFVRVDLPGKPEIPALTENVVDTRLATTLAFQGVKVSTVEHLMAALYGLGVDNMRVEISGAEVPIFDGSSAPFVEAIEAIGTLSQTSVRPVLVLNKRIEIKVGSSWVIAEPSSHLEVHSSVEFDHPSVGKQEFIFDESQHSFKEIANARTFCFYKDVEKMKELGLIQGGSLDNAVVFNDDGVLNPEGLRHSDELVRHKVLDALGDFKLSGFELQAKIRVHRGGHEINSRLIQAILEKSENFKLIEENSESSYSEEEVFSSQPVFA